MKSIRSVLFLAFFPLITMSCANSTDYGNEPVADQNVLPDTVKTIIVDVRTEEEWNNDGHAACSINYPLDELNTKIKSLQNYDKVILVCRSGSRASAAKDMLEQAGFKDVENKGAWQNISCK